MLLLFRQNSINYLSLSRAFFMTFHFVPYKRKNVFKKNKISSHTQKSENSLFFCRSTVVYANGLKQGVRAIHLMVIIFSSRFACVRKSPSFLLFNFPLSQFVLSLFRVEQFFFLLHFATQNERARDLGMFII